MNLDILLNDINYSVKQMEDLFRIFNIGIVAKKLQFLMVYEDLGRFFVQLKSNAMYQIL